MNVGNINRLKQKMLRQNFCICCINKSMKALRQSWIILFVLMITCSSCEAIGGIFKAGMSVGIFVVVLVVALILWLVMRGRR